MSRPDGARLRQEILAGWEEQEPLILDFTGVRVASVSFFDECLGVLALAHPLRVLGAKVRVEHIDDADRRLLNTIVNDRAGERAAQGS